MVISTKYTTITANSEAIMRKFHRKISNYIFCPPKFTKNAVETKVDNLFEKVQKILDMKLAIPFLQIELHNKKESRQLLADNGKRRSFYIQDHMTIYVNADDIRPGMLAHEMCHHIVDNWVKDRLPKATTEIIANWINLACTNGGR